MTLIMGGGNGVLVNTFLLKCVHVNLNCLSNKVPFVDNFMHGDNIDILGISESWLNSDILDAAISIQGYVLIRSDSPSGIRKHGVALYVKDGIKYEVIEGSPSNTICIYLTDYKILFFEVYRPPSNSSAENLQLINYLTTKLDSCETIILGDLNLPSIDWINENNNSYVLPTDRCFIQFFNDVGLSQMIHEPTNFPSGTTIDLCLVTDSDRVCSVDVLPPFPSCSHGIVTMSYTFQGSLSDELTNYEKRIWSRANFAAMKTHLENIDWHFTFAGMSLDEKYQSFLQTFKFLENRYVPLFKSKNKLQVPWSLNPPRELIRNRKLAWSNYMSAKATYGRHHTLTSEAWSEFCTCNRRYKSYAVDSQISYEKSVASQLGSKPKLFHSYIRHRKVGKPKVGPLRTATGDLTDDPADMAAAFSYSFAGVFNPRLPLNPKPHQVCNDRMRNIVINNSDVIDILLQIDVNSSGGYDGVPPRFLRELAPQLSVPLTIIFNESLQNGALPDEWLRSVIVPIFKDGTRSDALNYRPVSITSLICKSLERIIVLHLNNYLTVNSLISNYQFGFRAGHSTLDQLLLTYNDISLSMDEGKAVDLVFFDYSKAFDKVSHIVLLNKLFKIGVSTQLLRWIRCFLMSRVMQVKVSSTMSEAVPVTSGVPQGSVLGPVLFLIFVNNVVANLNCKFMIFADDIKLYLAHHSDLPFPQEVLQSNINLLVETSASWGLMMNVDKCFCIRFSPGSRGRYQPGSSPYSIGPNAISLAYKHKDLGLIIDGSLKFHDHVRRQANICNGLTANIFSCTLCRDADFLMSIYIAYIRPKLEYCSVVWNLGYAGDTKMLERVQRRWTRKVRGLENSEYGDRLRQLNLFSVQGRLLRADLIMVWKIFNGKCAVSPDSLFLMNLQSNRGHNLKIYKPRYNIDIRKRSFAYRVIDNWNSLPSSVVNAQSLSTFKSLLQNELGPRLFYYSD